MAYKYLLGAKGNGEGGQERAPGTSGARWEDGGSS